ncbi:hypothetical protein Sme01_05690 [Sphaerisporangium melleum]|uniref:Uncharacterized protein n=1 Tax=Sphaerisporangium melleum TaxID=321316 RepID=A0A917QRF5_9ACTN|nr:hypothetical protein [Sphaerisporangium melleum]GGK63491.1 hypothetical protein GCM10007964_03260 [Sphaerisporangium melleum]GII68093.1 hypothetical protein Sme01_05690 [Sphaerisporangium melleum]
MTDDRIRLSGFEERLLALADERGFTPSKPLTVKCAELEHRGRATVIYLDREKTARGVIAVFVSPESDLGSLRGIPGLTIPADVQHHSGMTRFPRRINRGKTPTAYGYLIRCADLSAYGRLLDRLAAPASP